MSKILMVFSWLPDAKDVIENHKDFEYSVSRQVLKDKEGNQIYLREVQNLDDAYKLAGMAFDKIVYNYRKNQIISDHIISYLNSLIKRR